MGRRQCCPGAEIAAVVFGLLREREWGDLPEFRGKVVRGAAPRQHAKFRRRSPIARVGSALEKLIIGDNAVSEAATAALRAACAARGIAAYEDYFNML